MVKKLEKRKTAPKIASQPPKKQVQKERDKRLELNTKIVTSTTLG
jgi:hypothetical protein